jgi:hypothetical protein
MQRFVTFLAAAGLFALSTGIVFAHDGKIQSAAVNPPAAGLEALPSTASLPQGVVQVSPFIPGMGEHWADPKNLPFGPIYCVIDGKITCMEYMISQADFEAGKSFELLRPWSAAAAQPPIDHMEFNFEPNGHEGYQVPHYDVHMYFVSPEIRQSRTQAQR